MVHQVQGRRGGEWIDVPGERYFNPRQAGHRRTVYARLITDAEFRIRTISNAELEQQAPAS